jgi:NitT/TauT family transport system substrate-binding protein
MLTIRLGLIALLLATACAPGPSAPQNLQKVVVQVGWILNGGIAPECAAIVKGYYAEQGMDVELRPGGPSGSSYLVSTLMLSQQSDIDIAVDSDIVTLVQGRAQPDPLRVKLIGAFWQDIPAGMIVRESSGLKSLKDLAGKRPDGQRWIIGATPGTFLLDPLADYIGVPRPQMNIVQTGFDAAPLLAGQVDALFGFWTTQAYELEKAKIPWKFLPISEMPGWSQPSYNVFARDDTIKQHPDLLVRWMRATIKGAKYVVDSPDEAGRMIPDKRCGGPQTDVTQETWLIKQSLPLYKFAGSYDRVGSVNPRQVTSFADSFYRYKNIPRALTAEELMDLSIIDKVYSK